MATVSGILRIKQRAKPPVSSNPTPSAPPTPIPAPILADPPQSTPPAPKLKIVIRRLPASMSEVEYNILTADVINKETVEWSTFTAGKLPQDRNKSTIHARAYCKVRDIDKLLLIKKALEGKQLTDTRGQESKIQVEFAPFQKIPRTKGRIRNDARSGTIEKDPEFMAFLENLKHTGPNAQNISNNAMTDSTENSAGESAEQQRIYQDPLAVPTPSYDAPLVDSGTKPTSTPLVEYIKQQKLHPKIKDKGKAKATADDDDAKSTTSSQGGHVRQRDKDRKRRGKDKEKEKEVKPVKIMVPDKKTPRAADTKATSTNLPVPAASTLSTQKSPKENAPASKRDRRERGNAGIAAAAILQRDLGISGGRRRRDRLIGEKAAEIKPSQPVTSSTNVAEAPTSSIAAPAAEVKSVAEQTPSGPSRDEKQKGRNRNRRPDKKKESTIPKDQAGAATPTSNIESSQSGAAAATPSTAIPNQVNNASNVPQNSRGRGGRNGGGRGGRAQVVQSQSQAQSQSTTVTPQVSTSSATPSTITSTEAISSPATSKTTTGLDSSSTAGTIPTGPKNMQNTATPTGPAGGQNGTPHRNKGRGFGGPYGPYGPRGGRGRGFRGGFQNGGTGSGNGAGGGGGGNAATVATNTPATSSAPAAGGDE